MADALSNAVAFSEDDLQTAQQNPVVFGEDDIAEHASSRSTPRALQPSRSLQASSQASKPLTFGEDEISKQVTWDDEPKAAATPQVQWDDAPVKPRLTRSQADQELSRLGNPLGPGSVGYKEKPAPPPSPKFTDVWYPHGVSQDAQAGAARAASPQAAAEKAAGRPLAPPAGAPHDPQLDQPILYNAKTGTPYQEPLVPEAEGWRDPLIHIAAGAEPIATGLSRISENQSAPGVHQPIGMGITHNQRFGNPPVVTPEQQAQEEINRRQRSLGAAEVIGGAGQLGTVAVPAALATSPLKVAAGYGAGYLASEGAGAAVHDKVSPEDEELIRSAAFFLPSTLGTLSGLKTGSVETPEGKFSAASIFGGRAKAGVGVTPETYTGRVKVGGTQLEVNIPRNGSSMPPAANETVPVSPNDAPGPRTELRTVTVPTETSSQLSVTAPVVRNITPQEVQSAKTAYDEAVSTMVRANAAAHIAAGNQPVTPTAPQEPTPGQQFGATLSGRQIEHIATSIASRPRVEHNDLVEEAHNNIVQWIRDNDGRVVIDSKVYIAKTPDDAEQLAANVLNNALEAHSKAQPTARAVTERQVTDSAPVQQPIPQNTTTSQPAPAMQKFIARSRPVATRRPVVEAPVPGQSVASAQEPDASSPAQAPPVAEVAQPETSPHASPNERHGVSGADRRQDQATRKRVAEMSPAEQAHELLTSEKTGLPNNRAFEEDAHELSQSHPHVGYADLDDFKSFNTTLGHDAVDNVVLPAMGDLFRAAATREGGSVRVYHRSGDEFVFRANQPESVSRVVGRVNEELRHTTFTVEKPDGTIVEKKGTGLSHGTGPNEAAAESAANIDKERRKELGLRSGTRDVSTVAEGPTGGQSVAVNAPSERQRVPQPSNERGAEAHDSVTRRVPEPGHAGRVPVDKLILDPKRFQYKLNVNEKGVTNLLSGRRWNDELAGIVSVWRDPSNGKLYVVNGHHRVQLAKENHVPDVLVRHLNVATAEEARSRGALQNIAEGRGTAIDAAKFFRDTGIGPEELDRQGISLGEATAVNGLALSKLDRLIFEKVATGKMGEGRGVAIGQATDDPAQQEAIVKLLDKREAQGKNITDATVSELARFVANSGNRTVEQGGLFGANQQIHSLALEKAEISAYIKQQIAKERRIFSAVSSESRAQTLQAIEGQNIKATENRQVAEAAAQAEEAYNKLSSHVGPVNGALEKAARELASGYHKPQDIKARAYATIREEIRKTLSGSHEPSAEGLQGRPAVGAEPHEAGQRQSSVSPTNKPPALPGMQPHIEAQESAAAEQQGEDLSRRIATPQQSISAKTGELERNSPLFRDTEASSQSGLFKPNPEPVLPQKGDTITLKGGRVGTARYVDQQMGVVRVQLPGGDIRTVPLADVITSKDRSGEAGFARLNVPATLGKEALRRLLEPSEETKVARSVDDRLFELDKQYEADVLRAKQLLESITTTPEDQEAIYHHMEDPFAPITPAQQRFLDEYIQPLAEASREMRTRLNDNGIPVGEAPEGYIHRIVQGRASQLGRAAGGQKGTGKGNVLSKYASSLQRRQMFAAERTDDPQLSLAGKQPRQNRIVVHRGGGKITGFQDGQGFELAKDKPGLNVGDTFHDKDGNEWTLLQATTKEIEQHTNLRYYKNALATSIADYLQLRRAERANDGLDAIKQDPGFQGMAFKPEHGEMPPDGWRPTTLPQFRSWYFEPRTSEVLERYARQLHGEPYTTLDRVGNFMTASLLLNPVRHIFNIGNHWLVERGASGNFNPLVWPRAAKAGIRAIKAVMTQNDDFVQALDRSAPMMSHRQDLQQLHQKLYELLLQHLESDHTAREKIAQFVGLEPRNAGDRGLLSTATRVSGFRLLDNMRLLGQRAMWMSNDIFMLQSAYEKQLLDPNLDFKDAIALVAKHIPDYRIPDRVMGSKRLADVMRNPLLTIFSRYHYGVWKSYGQMLRETFSPESSLRDRARGLDHMLMLGLVTFILYELWDHLLKKITGDPNARMVRSGASAVPAAIQQVSEGRKEPGDMVTASLTPNPLLKTGAEIALNRDFYTGGKVYDEHAAGMDILKDIGMHTAGALGPVQQYKNASYKNNPTGNSLFSQVGVSFPKYESQTPAQKLMHDIMRDNLAITPELRREMEERRERIARGEMTPRERKSELRKQVLNEFQFYLPHLRYSEIRQVFKAANPEEREIIRPIMLKKAVTLMRRDPFEGAREGALNAFEEK